MKPTSLYVHWPWCQSKCPYCDFNSHTTKTELMEEYLECLLLELEKQREIFGKRPISTIFFGGGTPSLMKPEYVEQVIDKADKLFTLESDCEISLEANPGSSDAKKFKGFKTAGVNRLSIGVQSFHDEHLKFLGRVHTGDVAIKTVSQAIEIFNNVNFDLIYGLPNQELTHWVKDLHKAVSLGSKHISAYQLTIEPNTKFFSEVKRGKWQPLNNDLQADFFEETQKVLFEHNFNNYEISNFCVNGHECAHNFNIWHYNDYLGIGAGAHGRVENKENKKVLTQNFKQIPSYIDSVKHRETLFHKTHPLTHEESMEEKIFMGLRLRDGFNFEGWQQTRYAKPILSLEVQGLLHTKNQKIALTTNGWAYLDTILAKILVK